MGFDRGYIEIMEKENGNYNRGWGFPKMVTLTHTHRSYTILF